MDEKLLPYKEHLNEIRKALSNNNAYLFIGAGFSRNAEPKTVDVQSSFKTWTTFMEQLAQRLWPNLDAHKIEKKVAGNHLYIAQIFEEEFGTTAFYKELLQAIPYKDYIPSSIHKELLGMEGWKGFITTNQDCLVEQTLDQLHIYHDVAISDLDIATKNVEPKVLKLHGSMERPESIIFTEEQYRTYEQDHPLMHVKVKSIFAENCVVFVGFSLDDVNFKEIYGWVKDVLNSDYQRKAYAFVMEDDIDSYTKRYWEKRNIILIPIFTEEHKDLGAAFRYSLRQYINALTEDEEVSESNENNEDLSNLLRRLLDKEELQVTDLKEFHRVVENIQEGSKVFFEKELGKFIVKFMPSLDDTALFQILQAIYKKGLLSPFYSINGKPLIDRLIDLLKNELNESLGLLYQYLLQKAQLLLQTGQYEEMEDHVSDVFDQYSDLPDNIRNSFLYLRIIIEKYRMNFEQIHTLVHQLVIDWYQPIWLNRVASIYLFLGEKSLALNLYNRTIQVAETKKDDWNLYVAYLSKNNLINDPLVADSHGEKEKKTVQQNIRRLSQKMKEMKHPTLEQWQGFDDLRTKWRSDYETWKSRLAPNQTGFHSLKGSSLVSIYDMIYFHEIHGFPHVAMLGKKYDVLMDIFIENDQRVRGTAFGILLGHDKQIRHSYRLEELTRISEDERVSLYSLSIHYAKNILWYIGSLRQNSYYRLVQLWLPALVQFWNKFLVISKDNEIDQIADYGIKLIHEIQDFPEVDWLASAQEKLIRLLGICHFYRRESVEQEQILRILRESVDSKRLINAFSSIDWSAFKKGSLPDKVVEGIFYDIDNSSVNLVYKWLEEGLLTEKQNQTIFQRTYESSEDKHVEGEQLQRAKVMYLQFFKEDVGNPVAHEILEGGIQQFCNYLSTSNTEELQHLSENVEIMNKEQVEKIIHGIENKLDNASSSIVLTTEELMASYLILLFKLWSADQIDEEKFTIKLKNVDHLNGILAEMIEQIARIEKFDNDVLPDKLLQTSYSYQVKIRQDGYLLIGFWLKERLTCEENEKILLDRLFIGLDDSNVEVASAAIQGTAFILKDNPSFISHDTLAKIIQITERGIQRNEVSYLTNLAFLFKELSKQDLAESEKETVTKILTELKQSNYSIVRRECELKDD